MTAAPTAPDVDLGRQREVVDSFFAAAHDGRFEDLVAVLDPEIVLRSDGGVLRPAANAFVEGAEAVASRAMTYASLPPCVRPALVNRVASVVVTPTGGLFSIMAFTVRGGRVAAIDALADPERRPRHPGSSRGRGGSVPQGRRPRPEVRHAFEARRNP